MSISQVITDFTTIAIQAGGWMEMDRIYVQNRLLHLIGEDALENTQVRPVTQSSLELLDQLLERALKYSKRKRTVNGTDNGLLNASAICCERLFCTTLF